MDVVTFDLETTTRNKGNVYDPQNKLCSVVTKLNDDKCLKFYPPFDKQTIVKYLSSADLVVGFNLKFDLAWIRREFGYQYIGRIFDCQYAEYLFSNQTWKFPDLETSCSNRGLGNKLDFIKLNYWDKGIDTDEIPLHELLEYNEQDVEITYQLYKEHLRLFESDFARCYRLFRLHMWDLHTLLDMEWNGLKYNKEKSLIKSNELDFQIKDIERRLNEIAQFEINWNSNPEKAAFLYGGEITRIIKVPVGNFKSGKRVGEVKFKNVEDVVKFERIIEPLKNGQEDNTSVAEPVLRSLKTNKHTNIIIELILERAKLEKMNGTYLKGLPNKMETMGWGNYLHPSYNQCVAVTGRVSSSNPNGQNIPPLGKQLIESRF